MAPRDSVPAQKARMSRAIGVLAATVGCGSVAAPPARQPPTISPASLVGTTWVAEDIDGRGVLDQVPSTLSFDSPQRISGRAACNRYFASVEQQAGTVRLRPAGTTRMACPPAVMDQEQRFLSALGAVTTLRVDAGKLLPLDESGRVRVRLAPLDRAAATRLTSADVKGESSYSR